MVVVRGREEILIGVTTSMSRGFSKCRQAVVSHGFTHFTRRRSTFEPVVRFLFSCQPWHSIATMKAGEWLPTLS